MAATMKLAGNKPSSRSSVVFRAASCALATTTLLLATMGPHNMAMAAAVGAADANNGGEFLASDIPMALDNYAAPMARAACQVTVSVKTVHSEVKPYGNIEAVLVKGAQETNTAGGTATSAERCVYYFGPDVEDSSSTPQYKGRAWPYVVVPPQCSVAFDASVPTTSRLRKAGFVSVQAGTRLLLIGGLPVYQYPDDEDLTCYCNEPPEWSSIDAAGNPVAF